jgi:hypothetical protein
MMPTWTPLVNRLRSSQEELLALEPMSDVLTNTKSVHYRPLELCETEKPLELVDTSATKELVDTSTAASTVSVAPFHILLIPQQPKSKSVDRSCQNLRGARTHHKLEGFSDLCHPLHWSTKCVLQC